jgi:glycosyltransferase 2 family protein
LLLALGYVIVALLTDSGRLSDALRQIGWLGCGMVLGLSATNYLIRFLRWQHYLTKLGHSLPSARHFLVYLSGFAFTVSPAKAGEAVRSLYLRDHGVTYTESIAAFFVERLLDMFAMVILAGLIVFDHPSYRPLLVATSLLLIGVLVCVCQSSLPPWIDRITKIHRGRLARLSIVFANLLRASRTLLHPQPLVAGIAAGLIAWGAEGIGFYIICQGLHIDGSVWTFCGIYAVSVLAGTAAFFLPAGIGGMEVVMTTLLVERGATLRVAIIATLLCRLATLWFAVLLGVGAASAVELSEQPLPARPAP